MISRLCLITERPLYQCDKGGALYPIIKVGGIRWLRRNR